MCSLGNYSPTQSRSDTHRHTLSHTHTLAFSSCFNVNHFTLRLYSPRSQVELNRAILKNVGKRVFLEPVNGPWASSRYQERQQEQQQQQQLERQQAALREQLRREQLQQQHFPSQLWSIGWPQTTGSQSYAPSSSSSSSSLSTSSTGSSRFFDFLQRPEAQARHQQQQQERQQQQETAGGQQLLDDASKSLGLSLGVADVAKHQQSRSQSNGNEIANETNHENGSRKSQLQSAIGKSATGDEDEDNVDDDAKDQEDMLDELYYHWATEQPDELEEQNNANGRLPWRLFYRMHKNSHYAN